MLEQKPFIRYNEEKIADTFTIKLNDVERKEFEEFKKILEQSKDSTAMKQLAWIGAKVLLDSKTSYILKVVFDNKRKNKRIGILEFES